MGYPAYRKSVFEHRTRVGAAGLTAGSFLQYAGQVWFSQNQKDLTEGEYVAWRSDQVIEVEKTNAADVINDGDVVNIDLTTKVQAAGGVASGRARAASGAGVTTVLVALNTN